MLSLIYAECHLYSVLFLLSVIFAECHFCWVSFLLSVIFAECHLCWMSFMLSEFYAEYRMYVCACVWVYVCVCVCAIYNLHAMKIFSTHWHLLYSPVWNQFSFKQPIRVKTYSTGGRKSKRDITLSCLVWVFNFKLACFVTNEITWLIQVRPHLDLKTRLRFCPVRLSLSTNLIDNCCCLSCKLSLPDFTKMYKNMES
jgi:hypothetical protein